MSEEQQVVVFCISLLVGYSIACAWFREYGRKNREKDLAVIDSKSHQ